MGGQTAESLEGLENLSHNNGTGAKVTIPAHFSKQDIHFSRQDIHANIEKNINTQSRGEFNTPTKRRLIQNENTKTLNINVYFWNLYYDLYYSII